METSQYCKKILEKVSVENDVITITLSKKELINPALKESIENGTFQTMLKEKYQNVDNATLKFVCRDDDVFFNRNEGDDIWFNAEAIKSIGGDLSFCELVNESYYYYNDNNGRLTYLKSLHQPAEYHYTFDEVWLVHKNLLKIARKINNSQIDSKGKIYYLSPFEKFMICFKIAHDLTYNTESDKQRSLIGTIKGKKGCCAGIAKVFTALLKEVGITCAYMPVQSRIESYFPFLDSRNKNTATYYMNGLRENYKNLSFIDKDMSNHRCNIVYLEDKKYGINGTFAADATWDKPFFPYRTKELNMFFALDGLFWTKFAKNILNFASKCPGPKQLPLEKREEIELKMFYKLAEALKYNLKNNNPKISYNELYCLNKKIEQLSSFVKQADVPFGLVVNVQDKLGTEGNLVAATPPTKTKYDEFKEELLQNFKWAEEDIARLDRAIKAAVALEELPLAAPPSDYKFKKAKTIANEYFNCIQRTCKDYFDGCEQYDF